MGVTSVLSESRRRIGNILLFFKELNKYIIMTLNVFFPPPPEHWDYKYVPVGQV